jgi:hypothetical protein
MWISSRLGGTWIDYASGIYPKKKSIAAIQVLLTAYLFLAFLPTASDIHMK